MMVKWDCRGGGEGTICDALSIPIIMAIAISRSKLTNIGPSLPPPHLSYCLILVCTQLPSHPLPIHLQLIGALPYQNPLLFVSFVFNV